MMCCNITCHTFCVLLWQPEELLCSGGPMVDAESHQEGSPGVQSLLPARQHLANCLQYPCVHQAVLSLGFGEMYHSTYTERLLRTLVSDLGVKDAQGTCVSALESLCRSLGAVILSAPHSANLWQGVQAWALSLAQV